MSKNMAARGRGSFSLYIYIENLKNLLVRNHWTNCYIILQKYSFGNSVPRLFKPFGFVKKHGCQGVELIFPIYLYRKLEKSSCQKPLDQFHYNLAKMFPWWPCTKIVQIIVIRQKTWPLGDRAWNVALVTLYQDCSSLHDTSKNMAPRGVGLIFHISIEN